MKKRTKTFTAALIVFVCVTALIATFLLIRPASPLGTYISVHIECEQTQTPITGLDITLKQSDGTVIGTIPTDASGWAGPFGSGLVDGDYIIEFFWTDQFSYPVTIDCSQICWDFYYMVDNPEIVKHFYYDMPDGSTPPIVGLNVDLYEDGLLIASQFTDASGTVTWNVDVCHDYYLTYEWGGVQYTVPEVGYIHFDVPPASLVWEEWNGLEPKSGGG